MSAFHKWEIVGVLPGTCEEYDDWVLQPIGGILFHKHCEGTPDSTTLTLVHEGSCRVCGKKPPAGVLFRAKTCMLDEV